MSIETENRPWGSFFVLSDEGDHKVKRIVVQPGKRLSLQRHQKRQEHWYFVDGCGEVVIDDTTIPVGSGVAVDIPLGAKHRVSNNGNKPLTFIEVQTGTYFGEDDIERFEDDFGRS